MTQTRKTKTGKRKAKDSIDIPTKKREIDVILNLLHDDPLAHSNSHVIKKMIMKYESFKAKLKGEK